MDMETSMATVVIIGIGLIVYLLPSIIAGLNHQGGKKSVMSIFVLNLLLGWSLLGWVIALIWAFKKER